MGRGPLLFVSAFKSFSNRSNAFWYEPYSFQRVKSPKVWRVQHIYRYRVRRGEGDYALGMEIEFNCMPDPVTGLTIGAAVGVVAKQAQDFIAAVSGHPGESIGSILGTITKRRLHNAEAVGSKAHLTLLNIGVKAQAVPLPVLMPTLEGASLQEEPSMQEVWANLLANAADPRKVTPVAATFPIILKELSARDVRFLDAIEKHVAQQRANRKYESLTEVKLRSMFEKATAPLNQTSDSDTDSFEYSFALLRRHNLMTESLWPRTVDGFDAVKNPNPDVEIELDVDYTLSEIGRCFIAACKKPTPERKPHDQGPALR